MSTRRTAITIGTILALALGVRVDAQELPRERSAQAVDESKNESRGRTYILHLAGGQVLRQKARPDGASWQIKRGRDWVTLPEGSVTRAAAEYDVLKESKKLAREVRRAEPARQAAYADWLFHQGLYKEGITYLDGVLSKHPDQAESLAVLQNWKRIPLRSLENLSGLPADERALESLCQAAARFGPAARELALARLADGAEDPALAAHFEKELVDRSPRRRSFAALALRRLWTGKAVRPLLSRSILDSSKEVRTGAALALRDAGEPSLISPALRALSSKSSTVRSNAVQALGNMEYAAAVEPLISHLAALQSTSSGRVPHAHVFNGRQIAYVQDFDVEVAQNESIADPVINVLQEGAVLDAGVLGATTYVIQTERANVRRSLEQLTGINPGKTTKAWLRWWDEHGEEWKANSGSPGPPSTPSSPDR